MPSVAYDDVCRAYEYHHINVSRYSVKVNTTKQLHLLIVCDGKYQSYAT